MAADAGQAADAVPVGDADTAKALIEEVAGRSTGVPDRPDKEGREKKGHRARDPAEVTAAAEVTEIPPEDPSLHRTPLRVDPTRPRKDHFNDQSKKASTSFLNFTSEGLWM